MATRCDRFWIGSSCWRLAVGSCRCAVSWLFFIFHDSRMASSLSASTKLTAHFSCCSLLCGWTCLSGRSPSPALCSSSPPPAEALRLVGGLGLVNLLKRLGSIVFCRIWIGIDVTGRSPAAARTVRVTARQPVGGRGEIPTSHGEAHFPLKPAAAPVPPGASE